jgi:hypothetical protein
MTDSRFSNVLTNEGMSSWRLCTTRQQTRVVPVTCLVGMHSHWKLHVELVHIPIFVAVLFKVIPRLVVAEPPSPASARRV